MTKQPCFCTCCRQAQFERDEKTLAAQRSGIPTDADRIAAAVAALSAQDVSDAVKWTRDGEIPTAHEVDMGIAITNALAILEGRDQG